MYIREIHRNQIFWGRNSLLNCRCLQRDWLVLRWRIASLLLHTTKLFNAKFPLLRFHYLKFRDGRYQNLAIPIYFSSGMASFNEPCVSKPHNSSPISSGMASFVRWHKSELQSSSRRGPNFSDPFEITNLLRWLLAHIYQIWTVFTFIVRENGVKRL